MRVAVFGATGGTGKEIVVQALEMGYTVSALVRDPNRLPPEAKGIATVVGDVLDPCKVNQTLRGTDAVIVSLGNRSDSPENTVSSGTKHIIDAMGDHGVKRLVVITSLGVGDSKDQVPFAFKLVMKTVMRKIMADKELQEEYVQGSGLDWVILRPGELRDGPKTGDFTFGTSREITAKAISRADLASFALKQLVDDHFLRKAVAVT